VKEWSCGAVSPRSLEYFSCSGRAKREQQPFARGVQVAFKNVSSTDKGAVRLADLPDAAESHGDRLAVHASRSIAA
jgi:hypothetical protein